MEKNNQLLTYREFGYTPEAFFDYSFFVTEDYYCGLSFDIKNQEKQVHEGTPIVKLNSEEIHAVSHLCRQLHVHPDPEEKKTSMGSTYSVTLHGQTDKVFQEDLFFKKQMDEVMFLIRKTHNEELGPEMVRDLYMSLMNKWKESDYSDSPKSFS